MFCRFYVNQVEINAHDSEKQGTSLLQNVYFVHTLLWVLQKLDVKISKKRESNERSFSSALKYLQWIVFFMIIIGVLLSLKYTTILRERSSPVSKIIEIR